ncbi:hypothetical protein JAAARDRAFT_122757 [Jaapia argillacea MUCL 33604]|uniref:Protein kinase domain-containing protein n=1 Tax=Jaapia argillacea MUCL 33604 TaxID=933084 RepID=A0A067Q675_9AGAM|nr:hypothetical protein JAAARDRAFT_122757 [Jaapia argillacea MUCL 33604]
MLSTLDCNSSFLYLDQLLIVCEQREPNPINGGGFVDIFLAHFNGKQVTLKEHRTTSFGQTEDSPLMVRGYSTRLTYSQLFLRESLLWSQLDHPHILPFLGIHVPPSGLPSIVMPWLQGGTLMDFLKTVDSPGLH